MSPARWREVLHTHLREAMFRHLLSETEEIDLTLALTDESTEAYRVLHDCALAGFEPLDAAALIVGTVLVRRLAEAQHAPAREDFPDPFVAPVPEWAFGVAT
jgi:hypothetical protein